MNKNFEISLATLDFSRERSGHLITEACSMAASTKTPPEHALIVIRERLLAFDHQFNPSDLEKQLLTAYQKHAAIGQNNLLGGVALTIVNRSPVNTRGIASGQFLREIFQPHQKVGIFVDGIEQMVWAANGDGDADLPAVGKYAAQFSPIFWTENRGNDNVPSNRTRSWAFAVATSRRIESMAGLIAAEVPILAIITTGLSFSMNHALVRVDVNSRVAWMGKRDRLMPLFKRQQTVLSYPDKLAPLPGTIGKGGIHRLIYLRPDAPAIP